MITNQDKDNFKLPRGVRKESHDIWPDKLTVARLLEYKTEAPSALYAERAVCSSLLSQIITTYQVGIEALTDPRLSVLLGVDEIIIGGWVENWTTAPMQDEIASCTGGDQPEIYGMRNGKLILEPVYVSWLQGDGFHVLLRHA